ncbi:hydrolase [Pseudoalteromonas ruthenica]|uniref:hydrolase n=1 Tax=Pseudoalteromonas ruthenica TaxID=151081 RepID=UPI00241FCF33|nr:hydrolase [Pseudoalteromonas ruthenica]
MSTHFTPAWWMPGRHLQTILPRYFRPGFKVAYHREVITTEDDDFLDLAWAQPAQPDKPLVIILHGLEGNIDSFYAKGMMKALQQSGLDAVLMHFRNCSGEVNRQPRAYHSGETEDLGFLIRTLQQRFGQRPLAAVGFSLGGNVLAKYLGEQGEKSGLSAAAVVSAPHDLSSSCQVIRKSLGKIYQHYLLGRMKKSMARKLPQLQDTLALNEQQLRNINDLWDFDNQVTAPLHGFTDAEDYYLKSSAKPYLKRIATPTLIIHAEDDPMLAPEAVPRPEDVSHAVDLRVSKRGGHVGFISNKGLFGVEFWLEKAVPEFFAKQLGQS